MYLTVVWVFRQAIRAQCFVDWPTFISFAFLMSSFFPAGMHTYFDNTGKMDIRDTTIAMDSDSITRGTGPVRRVTMQFYFFFLWRDGGSTTCHKTPRHHPSHCRNHGQAKANGFSSLKMGFVCVCTSK